ncbi:MAG: sulfatase-like hydrolase/transferase [bacterium]|nr:sulfatase-like hydrolase/transferase [bacterium]
MRQDVVKPLPRLLLCLTVIAVAGGAVWWGQEAWRYDPPKVALIGIDGGEWNVIRPLIEAGELPNLARLVREGASGELASYGLLASPQIWTTIVTGKHFDEHGINWFTVSADDHQTAADVLHDDNVIPITSHQRRVPSLWDIVGQAGYAASSIAYWATWPATPVSRHLVSDRFSYSRFNKLGSAQDELPHLTYPEGLVDDLRPYLMTPDEVTDADRARFMTGLVDVGDWREQHAIVGEFDITYAQTETYRQVTHALLDQGQPDFFTVYFQGVDVISHYFWEFMEPETAGHEVDPQGIRAFGDTIRAFYRYQDEILGEILDRLDDDTVVIVVSDHGFRAMPVAERTIAPTVSGWHRKEGIILMAGPGVRAGLTLKDASVYDVMPTVLAIFGRPMARDLAGKVLNEAFEDGVLPSRGQIETYTDMPQPPADVDATNLSPEDRRAMDRLRGIGYLGDSTKEPDREGDTSPD